MATENGWTQEALYSHLQDAVDLELWTIPLYMSAMYSIKPLEVQGDKPTYPEAYHLLRSVVIQEMLHLEIACNLCNALGYTPQIKAPVYNPDTGIPYHTLDRQPPNGPFVVQLGPLNENSLNLFLEIEIPKELSPDHGQGSKDPQDQYDSIGEFYESLQYGVGVLWDSCYKPNNGKQKQALFGSVYKGFKLQIDSLESAQNVINVIATQGEGAPAEGDIPTEYDPSYDSSSKDPNIADADNLEDTTGHYERLLKIKKQGIPATYPELSGANANEQQQALNKVYQDFLSDLQTFFSSTEDSDNLFNNMWSLIGLVQAVWQAGACPEFKVS